MNREQVRKLDARIRAIKKAALQMKEISKGIQAVDRNANRILASVRMLEINISDLLQLEASSLSGRDTCFGPERGMEGKRW